jgi:uncharacterized membrane protein YeaQ/YmgE (transglycosylase-associated protein family)
MGVIAWLLTGLLITAAARVLVRHVQGVRGTPTIGMGMLGAVLGGFGADLARVGDSVMAFRGPTLIGAAIGSILLLFLAYRLGWNAQDTPPPHRPA